MSGLRSYDSWSRSTRNFAWLEDAVPGASDVDLCIERYGNVLIGEGKPWTPGEGITMPYGQWKSLVGLASQGPTQTVLLIGEADNGQWAFMKVTPGKRKTFKNERNQVMVHIDEADLTPVSQTELRDRVKSWFDNCEKAAA